MPETKGAAKGRASIAGRRFGRLVAIEFDHRDRWKAAHWRFRCDCGNENYVCRPDQVRRGVIQSCGCLRAERSGERWRVLLRKHGHAKAGQRSSEYVSWRNMLDRCYQPSSGYYHCYGGRGIQVCDRWRKSFEDFLFDMGTKPAPSFTIGRIDNDGNYEPSNCRWESKTQQSRNRSTNRFIEYKGRRVTIAAACEVARISRNVFDHRIRLGWSVEKALSTPVRLRRRIVAAQQAESKGRR